MRKLHPKNEKDCFQNIELILSKKIKGDLSNKILVRHHHELIFYILFSFKKSIFEVFRGGGVGRGAGGGVGIGGSVGYAF